MSDVTKSKQDVVVELVKEGVHTREEIRTQVGCTSGAFASYLSGMRNAAKYVEGSLMCPVEQDVEIDGEMKKVFTAVSFDDAEKIKAERSANVKTKASAKSPEDRLKAAITREAKALKAKTAADDRAEKDDENYELELRATIAAAQHELAVLELEAANEGCPEGLPEVVEPEVPEADQDELI